MLLAPFGVRVCGPRVWNSLPGSPRLSEFLLRYAPCNDHHPMLKNFDKPLKTGLSSLTNSAISDVQWMQAPLPVKDGGVTRLALPSFLASTASATAFLYNWNLGPYLQLTNCIAIWLSLYSYDIPEPPTSQEQSSTRH